MLSSCNIRSNSALEKMAGKQQQEAVSGPEGAVTDRRRSTALETGAIGVSIL